jgi:hypothetical protein
LSLVVFGVSIWAVVDAPSFLDLFEKVINLSGKIMLFRVFSFVEIFQK